MRDDKSHKTGKSNCTAVKAFALNKAQPEFNPLHPLSSPAEVILQHRARMVPEPE